MDIVNNLNSDIGVLMRPFIHAPKILIGFSGGVDSQVLLLDAYNWAKKHDLVDRLLAIHVHHGISKNADFWAAKAKKRAQDLGVEFQLEKVKLDLNSKMSLEHAARDARYAVIAKHLPDNGVLLLGQHLNDQVETFLLALKRGSGPTGLSSMTPVSVFENGNIVRPLLNITRPQIEKFAVANNIDWIEDESNQDQHYDRNFLRHNIIPQLTKRWPGWNKAVARSASICAEQEVLIDDLLENLYKSEIEKNSNFAVNKIDFLKELSPSLRNIIIRKWLGEQGALMPSKAQLKQIVDNLIFAKKDANPIVKLNNQQLRRYKNKLYLISNYIDISDIKLTLKIDEWMILPDNLGEIRLHRCDDGDLILPSSQDSIEIRFTGVDGEKYCPDGKDKSRKLKKLYQEFSIPPWIRSRLPILFYNDTLVAVAGLFILKNKKGTAAKLEWKKTYIC